VVLKPASAATKIARIIKKGKDKEKENKYKEKIGASGQKERPTLVRVGPISGVIG